MSTECTTCQPDPQQPEAQIAATAETTVVDAVAPDPLPLPRVTIEFCDRCRWLHRAQWTATELALTFPSPVLKAITIVPLVESVTAGRFRVWLTTAGGTDLVWCRKRDGGFPELKVLKQKIRDIVQPGVSLGHSDTKPTVAAS